MTLRGLNFQRSDDTPARGWVLLVAGSVALAGSLAWQAAESADRAKRSAALRQAHEAARQAQAASRAAKPELTAAQAAWASILPALRQPWLPALRAIEAATEPPVHLLSLSIDPTSGLVRIDGEAPDFETAVRYAGVLASPEALQPAQLRSHEAATDPNTGRAFVRFSAQSKWIVR